ncbi:MAG: hypothetical protein EOP39_32510, partial [Rubrivivax sp.]
MNGAAQAAPLQRQPWGVPLLREQFPGARHAVPVAERFYSAAAYLQVPCQPQLPAVRLKFAQQSCISPFDACAWRSRRRMEHPVNTGSAMQRISSSSSIPSFVPNAAATDVVEEIAALLDRYGDDARPDLDDYASDVLQQVLASP